MHGMQSAIPIPSVHGVASFDAFMWEARGHRPMRHTGGVIASPYIPSPDGSSSYGCKGNDTDGSRAVSRACHFSKKDR